MKNIIYISFVSVLLAACGLTQEIEIELPEYDNQIVVESYLIPGEPFSLLLTKSFSYFDPIPIDGAEYLEQLLVSEAEVLIKYDDKEVKLENNFLFNPFTSKFFNYSTNFTVPENYTSTFELEVRTKEGELITAKTMIPAPVPIDSVVIQFNESDTLARALTYWTDDANRANFYRRLYAIGNRDSIEIDFILDDNIVDNDIIVTGTNYDFEVGDTIFNTIYHTTQDYYIFMNSIFNAEAANGNPFSQPSSILSNVEGEGNPIGIFSGLNRDEEVTIVTK